MATPSVVPEASAQTRSSSNAREQVTYTILSNVSEATTPKQLEEFHFREKSSHLTDAEGKQGTRGVHASPFGSEPQSLLQMLQSDRLTDFELIQNCNGYSSYLRCFYKIKDDPNVYEQVPLYAPAFKFADHGTQVAFGGEQSLRHYIRDTFVGLCVPYRAHFTRRPTDAPFVSPNPAHVTASTCAVATATAVGSTTCG